MKDPPPSSVVPQSLDNEDATNHDDNIGVDDTVTTTLSTTTSTSRSTYETIAESFARITFAGLAGSMNGLALEKRQQQQQQQQNQESHNTTRSIPGRGRPPIPIHRGRPDWAKNVSAATASSAASGTQSNLPITWALSCMVFVGVLESFRVTSPTSKLYDSFFESNYEQQLTVTGQNDDTGSTGSSIESFEHRLRHTAIVSIGDYTMGGAVAGLAGAVSRIRNPASLSSLSEGAIRRRPSAFLLWGCVVGIGFGMIAGILQASIEIGKLYVEHEQNERQQQRIQQHQNSEEKQ